MLSKIRQKKQEGFTIIEVLIVLAIAGLILLVVFLAVPALQRNSRNTQRSNDAATLLGGMAEFVNNNNGSLPDSAVVTDTTVTFTGTDANDVEVNIGFYSGSAEVSVVDYTAEGNPTTEDTIMIVKGGECNGTNVADGPARGYVALYTLEDNSKQCRES
jgi:prepilin-type N-terminal cleavage/methylation domain-containing protein